MTIEGKKLFICKGKMLCFSRICPLRESEAGKKIMEQPFLDLLWIKSHIDFTVSDLLRNHSNTFQCSTALARSALLCPPF